MKTNTHAVFKVEKVTKDYVYIIDVGDHSKNLTVTNDAEDVIEILTANFDETLHQRVFYKDSDGNIDELLHDGDGKFTGFKAGHEPFTRNELGSKK
ncbi:MAG: hypothetical protein FWG98_06935 [Candidatus Cloacimonetes bacterium]|nr:hypothetical protein [Candidatus Cloacimonadota bacterium]